MAKAIGKQKDKKNESANQSNESIVCPSSVPRAKLLLPALCFRSIHLQKAGTMLSAATAARSVAKKVRWMISTL